MHEQPNTEVSVDDVLDALSKAYGEHEAAQLRAANTRLRGELAALKRDYEAALYIIKWAKGRENELIAKVAGLEQDLKAARNGNEGLIETLSDVLYKRERGVKQSTAPSCN